jgi:hypothetical protein
VAPAAASRQAVMEMDLAAADEGSVATQNHVLPIAFRIPETGHLYRFAKIMVTREAPQATLYYVAHSLISFMKLFALALAAALLYRHRRRFEPLFLRVYSIGRKSAGLLRPARSGEAAQ